MAIDKSRTFARSLYLSLSTSLNLDGLTWPTLRPPLFQLAHIHIHTRDGPLQITAQLMATLKEQIQFEAPCNRRSSSSSNSRSRSSASGRRSSSTAFDHRIWKPPTKPAGATSAAGTVFAVLLQPKRSESAPLKLAHNSVHISSQQLLLLSRIHPPNNSSTRTNESCACARPIQAKSACEINREKDFLLLLLLLLHLSVCTKHKV